MHWNNIHNGRGIWVCPRPLSIYEDEYHNTYEMCLQFHFMRSHWNFFIDLRIFISSKLVIKNEILYRIKTYLEVMLSIVLSSSLSIFASSSSNFTG